MSRFSKIIFGDGLDVTDLGGGVIQVDGGGSGMPGAVGPPGPAGPTGPAGPAGVGGGASDPVPPSPDAANAEFTTTTLGSGWAIVSALGVSNAALGQWVDSVNSTASVWNANTDIPGALVMQPYQGWRMKLWRAFAPGNTRWAIVTKVRLNQARSTDDRIRLGVDTSTSPDDNDAPSNCFFVELRAEIATPGTMRYEVGASYVNGGTAASSFFRDNWYGSFAYLALLGSTGTSGTVEAYVSSDGISWLFLRSVNTSIISAAGAGIKSMFLTVNDVALGSNCSGIIDFVRFLNAENRPWKAFGWT